jgi:hypothetical protein
MPKSKKPKTSPKTVFYDGAGRGRVRIAPTSDRFRVKMDTIISKRCPRHMEFLPIDEFYIGKKTKAYSSLCRECNMERLREYRSRLNIRTRKYQNTRRDEEGLLQFWCSKCKTYKYDIDFPISREKKCVDNRNKRHYHCRECHKEYSKPIGAINGEAGTAVQVS